MSNEKIWANGIMVRETSGRYGKFMKVGINLDDFIASVSPYVNDRGSVNLVINERRTPSDTGITHSVSIDTYGLDMSSRGGQRPNSTPAPAGYDDVDPFDESPF